MSRGHKSLVMLASVFSVTSMLVVDVGASTYHPAGHDIGFFCKAGKPKTLSYSEKSGDLEASDVHSPSLLRLTDNKIEIIVRYRFSESTSGFDEKHYYSSEIWLGDEKLETNNFIGNSSSFLFSGEAHDISTLRLESRERNLWLTKGGNPSPDAQYYGVLEAKKSMYGTDYTFSAIQLDCIRYIYKKIPQRVKSDK